MKTKHFWRIHQRVLRRVWQELPDITRDQIANDVLHDTELYKWFDAKVNSDALRLYEDEAYYDNQEWTFRIPS